MKLRILTMMLAALIASWHSDLQAAIVATIQPSESSIVVPAAGSTTDLTFVVSLAASANTESLLSYTIPIDIAPPVGTDPPAGFTVTNVTSLLAFPGQPFDFSLNPSEGDILAAAGQLNFTNPVTFTTNPTPVFSFTAAVDSRVVPNDYTFSFVRGSLLAFDADLTSTAVLGSPAIVRVTAVPEPSALGILSLVAVGSAGFRRSRRRS